MTFRVNLNEELWLIKVNWMFNNSFRNDGFAEDSHTLSLPSPLHQFEIKKIIPLEIGKYDLSFTNASAFMVLMVGMVLCFLILSVRKQSLVPTKFQLMAEMLYEFVLSMLDQTSGHKARPYFPFVLALFLFILGANLLGMIPYAYTVTSQIIVTFSLAMGVFILITVIGFMKFGLRFITYFVPKGVPKVLLPLIVPIELISYLSRPISLSIRLFANMMAGHTMLKVFAGFTIVMGIWGIAPLLLNVALTAFEIMVAVLQAYVFTILTCIYLHDALHLHA